MAGNRTGKGIKRRRIDDSVSKSFAHKHKDSLNNKNTQEQPLFTELILFIDVVYFLKRVIDRYNLEPNFTIK